MSFGRLAQIIRTTLKGETVTRSQDTAVVDEAVLQDANPRPVPMPTRGTPEFPDIFPPRTGEEIKPDFRVMTARVRPGAYILRMSPLTDEHVSADNTVTGVFEMRLDEDFIPALTTPYVDQLNCLRDDCDKTIYTAQDFKDPGLRNFYENLEHTLIDTTKTVSGITWEIVGVELDNWIHVRISAIVK